MNLYPWRWNLTSRHKDPQLTVIDRAETVHGCVKTRNFEPSWLPVNLPQVLAIFASLSPLSQFTADRDGPNNKITNETWSKSRLLAIDSEIRQHLIFPSLGLKLLIYHFEAYPCKRFLFSDWSMMSFYAVSALLHSSQLIETIWLLSLL